MAPSSPAAVISVSNDAIAGALVEFGSAGNKPELVRAVNRPVQGEDALSLLLADVVALVGSPKRIGIVADLPSGLVGPRDGVSEQAQQFADDGGIPMRTAKTVKHGTIVAVPEIEQLRLAATGAGLEVERIELAEAAAARATDGRRNKIKGVVIPFDLLESTTVSSEQLPALAGMALALAEPQPGNLIGDEARDYAPAGAGKGGIGWAVARMPVPIDFSRLVEASHREFSITMIVFAVSFVALIATLLLL